jgi:hypothetical protein
MKKTKKLVLNLTKVRELVSQDLDRANGGYFNSSGSGWCSSAGARKCGYSGSGTPTTGPAPTVSQYCVNK